MCNFSNSTIHWLPFSPIKILLKKILPLKKSYRLVWISKECVLYSLDLWKFLFANFMTVKNNSPTFTSLIWFLTCTNFEKGMTCCWKLSQRSLNSSHSCVLLLGFCVCVKSIFLWAPPHMLCIHRFLFSVSFLVYNEMISFIGFLFYMNLLAFPMNWLLEESFLHLIHQYVFHLHEFSDA